MMTTLDNDMSLLASRDGKLASCLGRILQEGIGSTSETMKATSTPLCFCQKTASAQNKNSVIAANYLTELRGCFRTKRLRDVDTVLLGAFVRVLLRLPDAGWVLVALKEVVKAFPSVFVSCLLRDDDDSILHPNEPAQNKTEAKQNINHPNINKDDDTTTTNNNNNNTSRLHPSTFSLLYGAATSFSGCRCMECKKGPRSIFTELVAFAETSVPYWLRYVVRELCTIRARQPEGNVQLLRRTMELLPSFQWGAVLESNAFRFHIFNKNNKREYNLVFRTKTIQEGILKPLHAHIAAREKLTQSRRCFWDRLLELDVYAWSLDETSKQLLIGCVQSPMCPLRVLTLYPTGLEEAMAQAIYFNKSIEELKLTHSKTSKAFDALLAKSLSEGNCTIKYVVNHNATVHSASTIRHWCKLNRAGRAKVREDNVSNSDFVEVIRPQTDELSTLYGLLRENPMVWAGSAAVN